MLLGGFVINAKLIKIYYEMFLFYFFVKVTKILVKALIKNMFKAFEFEVSSLTGLFRLVFMIWIN